MLGWFRRRRRRQIAARSTPADWMEWIDEFLPWFEGWPPEVQERTVRNIKVFIAEKYWEGCEGLIVQPRMQVAIAAQAALMLTGIEEYCFDRVQTILVFPRSFRRRSGNGLLVWEESRVGEAWHRGPIVLSWSDVEGFWEGRNLVVHELAHHIDGLDGDMSGSPEFGSRESQEAWERVSAREFERLQAAVRAGRPTLIDPYGATSRAEFFAVACEHFFETSRELGQRHPELYQSLSGIFQADPATWRLPGELPGKGD